VTSCVVVLFAISHSYPREKPVNSDFFVTWPDEHVTLTHLSILEQRSLLPSLPSRTALMQPAANYGHCWSTPSHSPTQHEPFSSSLGCFLNLDTIQRHLSHIFRRQRCLVFYPHALAAVKTRYGDLRGPLKHRDGWAQERRNSKSPEKCRAERR